MDPGENRGKGLEAGGILRAKRHEEELSKRTDRQGRRGTERQSKKGKYLVSCLLLPLAWKKFGGSPERLKLNTATEKQI